MTFEFWLIGSMIVTLWLIMFIVLWRELKKRNVTSSS